MTNDISVRFGHVLTAKTAGRWLNILATDRLMVYRIFSLDMICHIRFFVLCDAVVRDCGGNLMPSQSGMTAPHGK